MIRAVLDANVLISGLLSQKGAPGQLLDAWLAGRFQLCISPQIVEEISRVLKYPRISERLAPGQAHRLLRSLAKLADLVEPRQELRVLTRDPSDNAYLACAIQANADFLVTGNLDHFTEAGENYRGVRILSPRAFLEILEENHAPDS